MKYKVGDYIRLKSGRVDGPIQKTLSGKDYPYRIEGDIYKDSEIRCKIEIENIEEEKWEDSATWNGDYDPKVPESFAEWAKGKKIKAQQGESVIEFFRLIAMGNFKDSEGEIYYINGGTNRWVEVKEPELKPYDSEHLPSCFTFREKETGNIYTMNYDSIENSFWCALGEGGRYWKDSAKLLANCENLDGSPCGWRKE